MSKAILESAEAYITGLYNQSTEKDKMRFHNIDHTKNVVNRINEIASHYGLNENEVIALNIAGWFHDAGHLQAHPDVHEHKSIELAKQWLGEQRADEYTIHLVEQLIEATKMSAEPQNRLEEIIKDADTYHLGTKEFKETDRLLKEELQLRNAIGIIDNWQERKIELLNKHKFYTSYAKEMLKSEKEKNLIKAQRKLMEMKASSKDNKGKEKKEKAENKKVDNTTEEKSKGDFKKDSFIAKGIQTMLRLTSENHMRLSDMADSKANILISVNAIIISIILSVLLRRLETDTYLTIPTLIFLTTAVTVVIIAILATRPKITKGEFVKEDIIARKTNLLFFGNFYKSSLEDYKWGMNVMMQDPNYLYGGLIDDIYYLGKVLGKKYKLLSIAYYIFMVGLIISVIAFIVALALHNAQSGNAPIPNVIQEVKTGGSSPF